MSSVKKWITGMMLAAALAAGGGYWAGRHGNQPNAAQPAGSAGSEAGARVPRKLLYYRNPMGLPDTSPVAKKDPMGMDYIPVYEGEAGAEPGSAGQISVSTEKIQKLGVRTEAASLKSIGKIVRAAGRIESDERRVYSIAPKFEGYVERLHVNATGQAVNRGQPLFEVYSPELVSAQREYLLAAQGVQSLKEADAQAQTGMQQLAGASLARLKNWDISDEQIKALVQSGDVRRSLTFRSPVTGIVTERKALQGMRFMPGEMLYQISDLSSVWVLADVFEQDIGAVRTGARATVRINAYADKIFEGRIGYVYPILKTETRTMQVRIELSNPGLLLKPGMFAQVELAAAARPVAVTVPLSAVLDSGTRRMVLVEARAGRFEPREVRLGERGDDYVEVLAGVREGERVVVAANFLIDAESNLKAAIGGFGTAASGGVSPAPAKPAGYQAQGTVDAIDAKSGAVSISHGPIASLKWPAMTMEFKLANPSLLRQVKPGAAIAFEFVERQPGEWVITAIRPADPKAAAGAAVNPHAGH